MESKSFKTLVPSDMFKAFAKVFLSNLCACAARRVPCLKTIAYRPVLSKKAQNACFFALVTLFLRVSENKNNWSSNLKIASNI